MKYAIHIIVIELFMQMSKVQMAFSLVDFCSGHEAPSLNPFEPEASEVNQLRCPELL